MKFKRKSKIISLLLVFTLLINVLLFNTSVQAVTVTGQDVVNYAKQFLGCTYVYGNIGQLDANGRPTFDCSGFTQYVYKNFGINLPRVTYDPNTNYDQLHVGVPVSQSDLQPGDLVFPHTGHVGIYVGDGKIIHAPQTGDVVKISTIWSFYAARRVPGVSSFVPIICNAFTQMNIMDSPNGNKIGTYVPGEQYTIIGDVGNWWQTNHGYIQKYTYTPSGTINIMNNPNGTKIGSYVPGESFTVISASGQWWRTLHGWINVINGTSYATMQIFNNPNGNTIGSYVLGESFTAFCENGAWWQTTHGFVQKRTYKSSTYTPIMNSPNGTKIGSYSIDESFILISKEGNWWKTNHGYVSALNVKSTITMPIMDSPNGNKIGSYVPGEAFSIIGESGMWWQTNHGWIRKI